MNGRNSICLKPKNHTLTLFLIFMCARNVLLSLFSAYFALSVFWFVFCFFFCIRVLFSVPCLQAFFRQTWCGVLSQSRVTANDSVKDKTERDGGGARNQLFYSSIQPYALCHSPHHTSPTYPQTKNGRDPSTTLGHYEAFIVRSTFINIRVFRPHINIHYNNTKRRLNHWNGRTDRY